jgi:tetratricopeptide (TPR) repeat protein
MNKAVKIVIPFFAGMILLSSCNDNGTGSPYDEIFTQPAFSAITDSIKAEPKNDDLYFRRAVLLNKNNFPEPALADFEKAWSLKKDERYAYAIGNLWSEKKPDSAIAFLNEALKELPESFLLRLNLARSYDALGKTDEALKVCDGILQINPEQVDVLVLKSDLLEKKGNSKDAISILEKAYSLTPFDLELNYNLAYKYAESKNAKVIQLCDSLAKKDSLGIHAEPYYYKGLYYSNINDRKKAISLFDEAIKHDFYFLNAYIEKSKILYDQSKFEEAYKVANLAMSISPKFADAYYWMAKCQEAAGNKEEARMNYQRAYGLDKTFSQAKEAADKLK